MKRFVIAAMVLAAFTAQAQDDAQSTNSGQWRLGLGAAFSDYQTQDKGIDDTQTGFNLTAQYQFDSWLGIEGGYFNTGDFETTVAGGGASYDGIMLDGGDVVQVSYRGFTVAGVGHLPLPGDEIDLFVKLGFFDFDSELALNGGVESSGHADGAFAGIGASLKIADQWGIRAGFDWYDVDEADLWSVILGAEYRF